MKNRLHFVCDATDKSDVVMKDDARSIFYERNMPHYQPHDAAYSVMMRLAGSLPAEVIEQLRKERDEYLKNLLGKISDKQRAERTRPYASQHFEKFQLLLDRQTKGPLWLKKPAIAEIVSTAMYYWDAKAYELLAYCIMPNHVHATIAIGSASSIPLPKFPLKGQTPYVVTNILASIKKHSAKRANKVLGRSGAFWQDETYDHVIRDEQELERAIWYVLLNPVTVGLIDDWKKWHWSYVKPGLVET